MWKILEDNYIEFTETLERFLCLLLFTILFPRPYRLWPVIHSPLPARILSGSITSTFRVSH